MKSYQVGAEVLKEVGKAFIQPSVGPAVRADLISEPHMHVLMTDDPANVLKS